MPIIHVVAFRPKAGQDAELHAQTGTFFAAMAAGQIPGVRGAYHGPIHHNLERAQGLTYILYIVAQDEKSLQAYGPSKPHMDYVKKLGKLVDKSFICDFVADRVAYGLVHIVNFNVQKGKEAQWRTGADNLVKESKSGSGQLPIDIIYTGPVLGKATGANHVLYSSFASKKDLDVYGPHKAHQDNVLTYLRPASVPDSATVFDFEVGPAPKL
ncbi:hypothetical protein DFJ74DRAFT_11809 [Hyaloraphidium curvatum]|nr:hypothetical protein DFJ74DRAFT_11809 [Hyaloraphidium curvatum]